MLKQIQSFIKKNAKLLMLLVAILLSILLVRQVRESFRVDYTADDLLNTLVYHQLLPAFKEGEKELNKLRAEFRDQKRKQLESVEAGERNAINSYAAYSHALDLARVARKLQQLGKSESDLLEYIHQLDSSKEPSRPQQVEQKVKSLDTTLAEPAQGVEMSAPEKTDLEDAIEDYSTITQTAGNIALGNR